MSFAVFLLYVFLSFFRPIELFVPELNEYRPMLIIWSVGFALALSRALSRREMAARKAHLGLLLGVCLAVVMSMVMSGWAGGAIQALSQFSPSVMLFVLVVLNITSLPRLKATCVVFVASLVLVSGFSINAYHTGKNADQLVLRQNTEAHDDAESAGTDVSAHDAAELVPAQDDSGWYLWRIRGIGFLNDPNDFAQALVITLPLLWASWSAGRLLRNLAVVVLPGITVAYTIVLTQSRGAVVGIAALLFFGVRRMLGTTRTLALIGVLGAVVVVGNVAAGRGFSSQERSAEERIEAWTVGIQLVRSYPLFGAGYGNFLDHNPLTAHNSYVLCFSELGLIGYFLWLGMIVLTYKGLSIPAEELPPDSPERRFAGLLRSSLVGFLACAWFLSRTYSPTLYFLLAVCVSTWWICRQSQPEGLLRTRLNEITWAKHTLMMMGITMATVYAFIVVNRLGG